MLLYITKCTALLTTKEAPIRGARNIKCLIQTEIQRISDTRLILGGVPMLANTVISHKNAMYGEATISPLLIKRLRELDIL
jgi:hypothetical protein